MSALRRERGRPARIRGVRTVLAAVEQGKGLGGIVNPVQDERGSGPREKEEKACRKCLRPLPPAAFPRNKSTRDGLSSWCRDCHREAVRRTRRGHAP